MVNQQNLHGKAEGAQQNIEISLCNRKTLVDAQKIEARHGQSHAEPDGPRRFLFQEQAENGDNDNVKRGDESRLAGRGCLHALLLEIGGYGQRRAAAAASEKEAAKGRILCPAVRERGGSVP